MAGCAGQSEIPFDRGATSSVKIIGLLDPNVYDTPHVVRLASLGQQFGVVGAVVEASLQASREDKFKIATSPQNFSARESLLKSVRSQLEQRGYTVVDVSLRRTNDSLLTQYPATDPARPVDAYLDLVVGGYGYVAVGPFDKTPYRPYLSMAARLVKAKDSSVLMQDAIAYNPAGPLKNAITIAPDPVYSFANFDALVADPKNAVKGMQAAVDGAAQSLGTLLK